ncbi:transcriptional regulator [Domibacillus antri]|uniref:Transcriptional regulator n=1 Tax=Domibacillus antri TaxID=1714264 RepID=A0A1Q8Q9A1_9BACI|nr:helix-turn-helix transcriptional regulator [Domibacillus antri]OLN23872.1 transcriptional regulator [Domibacillus antri]
MQRFWLKKLREDADKTHDDVAKEAAISRSFYTNIELGIKNPSVEVAKKIASVLIFEWTLFFANECSLKEQNTKEVS